MLSTALIQYTTNCCNVTYRLNRVRLFIKVEHCIYFVSRIQILLFTDWESYFLFRLELSLVAKYVFDAKVNPPNNSSSNIIFAWIPG